MRRSQRGSAASTVSFMSLKSDCSKEYPPDLSNEARPSQTSDLHGVTQGKKMRRSQRGSAASTVSFMSLKSDCSKEYPPDLSNEARPSQTSDLHGVTQGKKMRRSQRGSAASTVSFMSLKSDCSKEYPPDLSNEARPSQTSDLHGVTQGKKMRRSQRGSAASTVSFMSLKSDCSKEYPPDLSNEARPSQTSDLHGVTQGKKMRRSQRGSAASTVSFMSLKSDCSKEYPPDLSNEARPSQTRQDYNSNSAESRHSEGHYGEVVMYQKKLKMFLKQKNECLLEGITTQHVPVPLKKIYTKLYLIEGFSEEVNNEHEVRQIETAFNRRKTVETMIRCQDLFQPLPNQKGTPIRTVLTKGIAGIGKTVLAQKFMLDWSEGRANQDIQLMFSLPFRELNMIKNERRSLMELLNDFSPGLKESGIVDLKMYKVLFVVDGLDECRLSLDFRTNEKCCDATQSASVDVLVTNLINGNLLPKANLWITTRPAAANCIPQECVDRMTEIRGFNNLQKEQYFYKKIDDENLAKRVVANVKSKRSLYIMCHVPVFCWISSIVLGKMCTKDGRGKIPKTLTQMYIHFLAHQTTLKHVKYCEEQELDSQEKDKVIMSLGKLAFQQLQKGNLIFYEDDIRDCGIDVKEASVYSGVCTQVFREESCMQQRVFCFVHLSVQEFLAALYVHVMYRVNGINPLIEEPDQMAQTKPVSELHKVAVDRALQSDMGHLDLFLRFLLGLSLESSQSLLRDLKIQVKTCDSQSLEETIEYIKKKINQNPHPKKYINLFHCLTELNDHSLVEEIQSSLDLDRDLAMDERSAAEWAALVFVLLTSPEKPEEIDLKKYSRTGEGLLRLIPAIKVTRSAMLNDCNLTEDSFKVLSFTLSSSCNELIHLHLSDNNLQDSGINHLCTALQSPLCKLKTLRLNRCSLTSSCCEKLAAVLSYPSSHLRELDLSDNDIEDSGVELLSTGLGNVCCKLETLRLSFCNITKKGCGFLASAVKSNPFHLNELDLSYNHLGKSGVKLMYEALEEGQCEFVKLRVDHNAEHWFKPGLRNYACKLTLDPNTAHRLIILFDDQKMTLVSEEQPYPDHPDRFDCWAQVLSKESLTGRCYWEVEWEGKWTAIGVTYKGIGRKGSETDCVMGYNGMSWSRHCSAKGYCAYHNFESKVPRVPLGDSRGLAVYLDWKAGILSFYRGSSGSSLTHLHTFVTKFTEPLYPIFRVWGQGSSLKVCQVK